jgi:hypothetical protein
MCGLVGVISKYTNGFTQRQKEIFSTLLFVDTLRGDDSTGSFLVSNDGSLRLSKEASTAQEFMSHKDYDELMRLSILNGSALIGHNRKATKGNIIDENAHPFLVDDKICLVHNGTLWGDHKQHADVDVDSHAIAHLIAKEGVEVAINTINGAFALIWYNFEEETVNFLRNSQRPLWVGTTDTEWIWSSELAMLNFVGDRMNLVWKQKPFQLAELLQCSYKLVDKSWRVTNTKIEIKPKYVAPITTGYYPDACGYDLEDYEERKWNRHPYQNDSPRGGYVGRDACADRAMNLVVGFGDNALTSTEMLECAKQAVHCTVTEWEKITSVIPADCSVEAYAYDATCINGVDDKDGMFLWLMALDEPSVVLRHRYAPDKIKEEECIEYATTGCIFDCVVKNKSWQKNMWPSTWKGTEPSGFVLCSTSAITLSQQDLETPVGPNANKGVLVVH